MAVLLAVAGTWVTVATPAWAQSPDDPRRWEVEGHGGMMFLTGPGEGTSALPPRGAPIATSSPVFPTRRVPSWFFGDGAEMLGLVNQQFGVPARITPLDAALGGAALEGGSGVAGGVRVRRILTRRYAVELGLELLPSSAELSDELLAAVGVSRDSFTTAFQGLLATGPFTDVDVAASSATGGSSLELAATGALVVRLGAAGGFVPYLTLGAGVVTGAGDGPTATLEGRYRFEILDEVPIDETDRVTIRQRSRTAPVGVLGAGLRRAISPRWGVRLDGRVLVGPQTTTLLLDTAPMVAQGTPADFVESFTTPAIQFSNDPATGRESSLGGPGLQGFEAFEADGVQARVLVTAGIFVRF